MFRFGKIFFSCFFLLSGMLLHGQDVNRFLYFQSEPAQPFQIVYSGKLHASNSSGYLILTGLSPQETEFILVMDGNIRYRVDLSGGDRGMSIRPRQGSWGLWDVSRGYWIEPIVGAVISTKILDSSGASPFARLLSKAAKDPSLLSNRRKGSSGQTSVAAVKKSDSVRTVQMKDSTADLDRFIDSRSMIWQAEYLVPEGREVDTVRISIWSELSSMDPSPSLVKSNDTLGYRRFSSTCAAQLAESEFTQLRARMAAAGDEEEMVLLVRRVLRTHCMTVSQARRLCNIFLYDATRYRFFDALYGHVPDPEEFSTLGSFLTDPAYQNRFRSLLER